MMSSAARVAFAALVLILPAVVTAQETSRTYTEAVYQESMTGDLGLAIKLYKQAAQTSADASLVARATLRMGNCYRKLGQVDLARDAFRTVVDKFPSQKDAVRLAKLALLTIGPGRQELKKWTDRLESEVMALRSALSELSTGIDGIRSQLPGSNRDSEETMRVFDKMILREEARERVKRYLASHYFKTGLAAYRALKYENALEDFQAASGLMSTDRLIRGYLEKTEFIIGRRPRLTPDAMNSAPDDPSAQLLKELEAAYDLAVSAKEEGDYRMSLAAVEELLDRARWTHDELVTEEVRQVLEKADSLAEECLIRLYPAESRHLKLLGTERRELSEKLKKKLEEMLSPPAASAGTASSVIDAARELINAGRLPEAKGLLEGHLAASSGDEDARALLEEIDLAVRGEKPSEKTEVIFCVTAAAIALPGEESGMLKVPFRAVKPTEGGGVPFAWAVLDEPKGKEVLSIAALVGRKAVGKFQDMNVSSGQKGSGFLGSSMTYVSGYRRKPGAQEEYEPVSDIVFQGIKLQIKPSMKRDKVILDIEVAVSAVVGEPRTVQTEGGQIEIPRIYQVALKHSFDLNAGQYLIIGSFPNTLVPGIERQKDDMYLLISPRTVDTPSSEEDPSGSKGK